MQGGGEYITHGTMSDGWYAYYGTGSDTTAYIDTDCSYSPIIHEERETNRIESEERTARYFARMRDREQRQRARAAESIRSKVMIRRPERPFRLSMGNSNRFDR